MLGILFGLIQATEAMSLKLSLKPGDRFEYATSVHVTTGQSGDLMHADLQITEKVLSASKDAIEISHYIPSVSVKAKGALRETGEPFLKQKGTSYRTMQDASGRYLGEAESAGSASSNWDYSLPPNPVKVGDTWQEVLNINRQKIKVTYEYKGRVPFDGESVFKLVRTIAPGQAVHDLIPAEFLLSPVDLRIVRSTAKFEITSGDPAVTVAYKVQRLRKTNGS